MKIMKSAALTVVLLLALLVVFVEHMSTSLLSGKVARELDSIRQKGEISSIEQTIPPQIPPEENGAPYYVAAMDLINYATGPNKTEDLRDYFSHNRAELREQLKKNHKVFKLLKEAYNQPWCRFNLQYEEGVEMRPLNFKAARRIAQITAVKAYEDLENGKPQDAADDCMYGLRFLRELGQRGTPSGGALINLMINVACQKWILNPLQYMVEKGVKADYSRVLAELNLLQEEKENSFHRALEVERMLGTDYLEKLKARKGDFPPAFFAGLAGGYPKYYRIFLVAKYQIARKSSILADELFYLQFMRSALTAIESGKLPLMENPPRGTDKYLISSALIPNFIRAYKQNSQAVKDLENVKSELLGRGKGKP
ncbi:MAG: hypothetical protein HYU64_07105 [Armatimonadetes bacterium]|nr:hypothetical protein [Armatimonadota bacterium]